MKPITAAATSLALFFLVAPAAAGTIADFGFGDQRYSNHSLHFGPHDRGHRFGFGRRAFGSNFYLLPPSAIIRALRRQDFSAISRPRFRRGLYHARARDRHGRRVRLAINPYSGLIVSLRYHRQFLFGR